MPNFNFGYGGFMMNGYFWIFIAVAVFCHYYFTEPDGRQKKKHKNTSHSDFNVINEKLDDMDERLSVFQEQEREIRDLKSRIVALEKVISDRRFELDEKFRNL